MASFPPAGPRRPPSSHLDGNSDRAVCTCERPPRRPAPGLAGPPASFPLKSAWRSLASNDEPARAWGVWGGPGAWTPSSNRSQGTEEPEAPAQRLSRHVPALRDPAFPFVASSCDECHSKRPSVLSVYRKSHPRLDSHPRPGSEGWPRSAFRLSWPCFGFAGLALGSPFPKDLPLCCAPHLVILPSRWQRRIERAQRPVPHRGKPHFPFNLTQRSSIS